MGNNVTELVFILDKSGSMAGAENDTIGGFNAMIDKQKSAEGKVYVNTVFFSNFTELVHDRKTIEEIEPLTEKDYRVGGCTALFDAIGSTIEHISNIHKYARPEDVPERVMFVITTDGYENASRNYRAAEVKRMISEKEENGWEFLFLAANIDAVETAETIGIKKNRAVNYGVKEDTNAIYEEIGETICSYTLNDGIPANWARTTEERLRNRRVEKPDVL